MAFEILLAVVEPQIAPFVMRTKLSLLSSAAAAISAFPIFRRSIILSSSPGTIRALSLLGFFLGRYCIGAFSWFRCGGLEAVEVCEQIVVDLGSGFVAFHQVVGVELGELENLVGMLQLYRQLAHVPRPLSPVVLSAFSVFGGNEDLG